jgi:hypothetical protein
VSSIEASPGNRVLVIQSSFTPGEWLRGTLQNYEGAKVEHVTRPDRAGDLKQFGLVVCDRIQGIDVARVHGQQVPVVLSADEWTNADVLAALAAGARGVVRPKSLESSGKATAHKLMQAAKGSFVFDLESGQSLDKVLSGARELAYVFKVAAQGLRDCFEVPHVLRGPVARLAAEAARLRLSTPSVAVIGGHESFVGPLASMLKSQSKGHVVAYMSTVEHAERVLGDGSLGKDPEILLVNSEVLQGDYAASDESLETLAKLAQEFPMLVTSTEVGHQLAYTSARSLALGGMGACSMDRHLPGAIEMVARGRCVVGADVVESLPPGRLRDRAVGIAEGAGGLRSWSGAITGIQAAATASLAEAHKPVVSIAPTLPVGIV